MLPGEGTRPDVVWTLAPRCQTCGALMPRLDQVVYLWVRNSKHDPGRQIAVCTDCNREKFPPRSPATPHGEPPNLRR